MRRIERARMRNAALRYAERGWRVAPGAFLKRRQGRFDCGRIGCRTVGCHPAIGDWERLADTDRDRIESWWRVHPYTVLLATGDEFDVLEVPAGLGALAVANRRFDPSRSPVAVTGAGRWMFFVAAGHALVPELTAHHGVVLHGVGSWVPAPPSQQVEGRIRWYVAPRTQAWRPAEPYPLQALMLDALQLRRPRPAVRRWSTWAA